MSKELLEKLPNLTTGSFIRWTDKLTYTGTVGLTDMLGEFSALTADCLNMD